MTPDDIKAKVLEEYQRRYPTWTNVVVSDVIQDTFGGHLAVVRSSGEPEEMCFIYSEGKVCVFDTTEEFARFLEQKAKAPLLERLFSRQIFSGVVFALLLVAILIIGFSSNFRPEALTILGSVIGVAAGYFFGSENRAQ